jgi:hypothetical protein
VILQPGDFTIECEQPVVEVAASTEAGEAPREQGATTAHIGNM